MATSPVVTATPGAAAVAGNTIPTIQNPSTGVNQPVTPPVGSAAAGGPTHGQLFPVGNR